MMALNPTKKKMIMKTTNNKCKWWKKTMKTTLMGNMMSNKIRSWLWDSRWEPYLEAEIMPKNLIFHTIPQRLKKTIILSCSCRSMPPKNHIKDWGRYWPQIKRKTSIIKKGLKKVLHLDKKNKTRRKENSSKTVANRIGRLNLKNRKNKINRS